MVRWHQIRVVVYGDGVLAKTAGRLDAHKDVAKLQSGNYECAVVSIHVTRRGTPGLLKRRAHGCWPALEPLPVGCGGHLSNGMLQLFLGEKFLVIRPTVNERLHETIAVRRQGSCTEVISF